MAETLTAAEVRALVRDVERAHPQGTESPVSGWCSEPHCLGCGETAPCYGLRVVAALVALMPEREIEWCEAEDLYSPSQYEPESWVRCTQSLPHTDRGGEHYDSNTGHAWARTPAEAGHDLALTVEDEAARAFEEEGRR